ncbi:hypothetical protein M569_12690, partial [Genlisea aurea]
PPLVAALEASAAEDAASFHFPGHNRGEAAPPSLARLIGTRPFKHDLPELPELGDLFSSEGPIFEAQKLAAELFGASETWFLVGGSTCGIQTAIMSTCDPGDVLVLPRNAHISAVSGMVLSGALPEYVVPEYDSKWDVASGITPSQAIKCRLYDDLEKRGRKPAAVLIVSPSYHGICSDVAVISKLCHDSDVPLIVDEAHGAHFGFHPKLPSSALSLGADLVVQSTHKTLCSLTQSSMLHLSGGFGRVDRGRIRRCLRTVQSSSPSYLLLASLDAARAQLNESSFDGAIELSEEAKRRIGGIPGISVVGCADFPNFPAVDPLRITVGTWGLGLSGHAADGALFREFGVVSELVGTRSFTLAFGLGTRGDHVSRLVEGLRHLSGNFCSSSTTTSSSSSTYDLGEIDVVLSPREAFFAEKRSVRISESVGEICGEVICPYPPGIPLLFPGEVITESALNYLLSVRSHGGGVAGAADQSLLVVCR